MYLYTFPPEYSSSPLLTKKPDSLASENLRDSFRTRRSFLTLPSWCSGYLSIKIIYPSTHLSPRREKILFFFFFLTLGSWKVKYWQLTDYSGKTEKFSVGISGGMEKPAGHCSTWPQHLRWFLSSLLYEVVIQLI